MRKVSPMNEEDLEATEPVRKHEVDLGELRVAPSEAAQCAAAAQTHVASLVLPSEKPGVLTSAAELYRLLREYKPTELDLDTEFAGWRDEAWDRDFDIDEESCYLRVKAYLISLAFGGCPDGIVFEPTPEHLKILIAYIAKFKPIIYAHNAGVDVHALHGVGVDLTGVRVIDTQQAARWFFPSFMKDDDNQTNVGHGLDGMYRFFYPADDAKLVSYKEVFQGEAHCFWRLIECRPKEIVVCECRAPKCRKRSTTPGHSKDLEHIYVDVALKKSHTFKFTITPAELKLNQAAWLAWVDYARRDSAMLHRWRTQKLNGKVDMPAVAAPPECVRMK